LRGKDFIIQTDRANLAWIGANQTPIVARTRIPGTKMGLADYLSRMYQVNPEVGMDRLVVEEEQDARDMNDEYAENELFNVMVLSLVMGKYLAGDHDELLSEDGNCVIYAVVKKELSKDVDDKSNVKVEIQPPEYYLREAFCYLAW
jgi:hypothetical protein